MTVSRAALLVLAAAGIAVAGDPPQEAPKLPDAATEALAAFRRVRWQPSPEHGDEPTDEWKVRVRAEWTFASLEPWHVPAVTPLLADQDRFVRALAARSLGIIGGASAEAPLVRALEPERDSLAQHAILEALARVGGKDALAAVEALEQPGIAGDLQIAIGRARRQLRGERWDVGSIRAEHREALGTAVDSARIGETAPELGLPSPTGPVNLSLLEGHVVVLFFSHGDRSVKDAKILTRLAGVGDQLHAWHVKVVVVDCHEKERTQIWSEGLKLPFTFASDPSGRAQAAYGVARQLCTGGEWLPSPAWCVIDPKGRLAWRKIGCRVGDHAPLGELLPVLDDVSRGIAPEQPR